MTKLGKDSQNCFITVPPEPFCQFPVKLVTSSTTSINRENKFDFFISSFYDFPVITPPWIPRERYNEVLLYKGVPSFKEFKG